MASTLERALQSKGSSADAIYEMTLGALKSRALRPSVFLDVGCGGGGLWKHVQPICGRYIGIDIERYPGFPDSAEFVACNLESYRAPLPDASGDVVAAVETIEHLENPRAFARELSRLCKPGGWVLVTTPNQLSVLSKLTLVLKNQFNAFQDANYPAHITALLEMDLRRILAECGLQDIAAFYSRSGRIPGGAWHWPRIMSDLFPRAFSDNVCVWGRKPA